MQRYRINYHWLIGVFVGSLVLAVAAFFIQRWQVERKAGYFLTKAEAALAEDEPLVAFESFLKYVRLRPKEDVARIKMALAAADVVKSQDATSEQRGGALGVLDQTVRTTDDPHLRLELAEIMLLIRRPQDAIGHLEELLAMEPNDSELKAMLVRAYFQAKEYKRVKTLAFEFVGYDSKTDTFAPKILADSESGSLQDESDVYALLSDVLKRIDEDPDFARRVIDQMVAVNPDSPQANLRKSIFLSSLKEFEAAKFLDKAYQQDPKDAAILSRKGSLALYGFLYKESKAAYLEALSGYEEAVGQLTSKGSEELENSSYEEAKSDFEASIAGYEKSQPTYQESRTHYQQAKSKYEEALSKLAPKSAVAQEDPDYKKARENLSEAQANFEDSQPNYEAARDYFSAGLEEHPENVYFYRLMAETEMQLEQKEAALKILDEGIAKFEKNRSADLVFFKLNLLFSIEDYPAIDREIKRLTQLHREELQPIIDFQRARILFTKQEWVGAAKELKRLRPLLFNKVNYQKLAGTMLGVCYEKQGVFDLARQAYSSVLNESPQHVAAQRGLTRMDARLRQKSKKIDLDHIVDKTLELPEAEQDWEKVDELVEEVIAENTISESGQKIMRAKVLIKRGKLAEAKSMIRQAAKEAPDEVEISFAAIMLMLHDPEQGPATALKLLDNLEKKWGRSLRSLAQRADLLVFLHPEDLSEQLYGIVAASSELTEAEQARIGKVIGLKFDQLGKYEDAREFFEKAALQEPNNLPIRMHLFDIALRQGSDTEMQKVQESILNLVKSKDDASYLLNEVKRRIVSHAQGKIDLSELASCRQLLDAALQKRPEWHELHIAYGKLLLILNQEIDLVLEHFDKALEYGPARSTVVGVQVRLLADRGMFLQARERMDRLSKKHRKKMLGQLEADLLIKTGEVTRGYIVAEKLATDQPENLNTQIWFSQIAQQLGKLEVAATSLRGALKLNPSDPDSWFRLIGLYAEQKKFEEVVNVIREAHLASDAEFLPLLTAKYFELISHWRSAESIYLATYANKSERLPVSRKMADFYLFWAKKDPANIGRAAKYINRILKAANDDQVAVDNPHVIWARLKAVKILLAKNDYQLALQAERLLRQSTLDNKMSVEDSQLLADIMLARGDPQSLLQTIRLLSALREDHRLPQKGALQLARLLSQTNNWDQSKKLLLELISEYPSDPTVRSNYVDLLIDHGEYARAERSLKRLQELDPKYRSLIQLRARLASERGDQGGLNRLLTSLLPKLRGTLTGPQLKKVLNIAQLATLYGDKQLAEKLYRIYVQRLPDELFQLAKFLAYHGDCEEALLHMKRLYADHTDAVIQLASRMIGARFDEIGDTFDEQVDRLVDAALLEDPDSMYRQLARAELYDTQGKYEQSIAAYEQLLKRDDVPSRMRAAAMNNLGFLMALLGQRVDEAEQLINDAMETFGPVEDMLDTRAVVRIAQKKYDLAIEDLELALLVSSDPIKYFHLAKACYLAGDGQAALKAWGKAQSLGFRKEALPRLERATFEKILQEMGSFQTQNANL